jgi:mono/diheme cytochrome c family protein
MRRSGMAVLALMASACAVHKRPAPNLRAVGPVERGRYLYQNLMDCGGCHQPDGSGAPMPREKDIPGAMVAPNITPDVDTGVGRWTDGEKLRAIREGIHRDGRPLIPVMPYTNYRYLTDSDGDALVAYLNTLGPVRNALPRSKVGFVVRAYVRSWPRPAIAARMSEGEYLATMGSCVNCHSPLRRGRPVRDKRFAGGRDFAGGVRSSNITPDPETGIGRWSEQDFVNRFRLWRPGGRPSPMPWAGLSRLAEADLRALYRYLREQRAVRRIPARPAGGSVDK